MQVNIACETKENWFNRKRTQFWGQTTEGREMREKVKSGKWMQREEGVRERERRGLETGWLCDLFQLHLIDPFQ